MIKKIETADVNSIFNHTFIIEVNGKFILVVAGAPTEQEATLKDLLGLCDQINIKISFLLVAKRTREGKAGFDTLRDLNDFSELILAERINRVPPVDKMDAYSFKQDEDWKNRIDRISKLILENL